MRFPIRRAFAVGLLGAAIIAAAAAASSSLFAAGPPFQVDLMVEPDEVLCNGVDSAILTARVWDASFDPVDDGTNVNFTVVALGNANPVNAQTTGGEASSVITPLNSSATGIDVVVTSGAAQSQITIDCFPHGGNGIMRGIVTDELGSPIAGADIRAGLSTGSGGDSGQAITAADGSYEIPGLAPGNYEVTADAFGYLPASLQPAFVSRSSIAYDVDFTLGDAGSIAGRVTNGGVGVANAALLIAELFAFGLTDAQGFYVVPDLPPGNYTVRLFNTGLFAPEFYLNSYTSAGATLVNVNGGAQTPTIDFDLSSGGGVSGVIRDPNGVPLEGANVTATNDDWFFTATSGASGVYAIAGMAPGTYKVYAQFAGYATTAFGGVFELNAATPVAVSLGVNEANKDIQLGQLGSISGAVTNVPAPGASVHAADLICCFGGGGSVEVPSDGPYSITGLQPICYRVQAQAHGPGGGDGPHYDDRWHPDSADPVCVASGADTPNIDFALAARNPDYLDQAFLINTPGDASRNTAGATLEGAEAQPCGNIGATIWYRFALHPETLPGTQVEVDTAGSGFDTVVAVYSGDHVWSPPGGIAPVTCDDSGTGQGRAVFTGMPGATYYVQLGGKNGATGNAQLHVECIGDDDCDGDVNASDTCDALYNPDQADLDGDGVGDICDGDIDGDDLGNGEEFSFGTETRVADTDGDGCADGEEHELGGLQPIFGGGRDALNFWDFYDVTGDSAVDLADALAILGKFGLQPGQPGYDRSYDRYVPDPLKQYRTGQAMGVHIGIDLQDALINLQSFGHSCATPP